MFTLSFMVLWEHRNGSAFSKVQQMVTSHNKPRYTDRKNSVFTAVKFSKRLFTLGPVSMMSITTAR